MSDLMSFSLPWLPALVFTLHSVSLVFLALLTWFHRLQRPRLLLFMTGSAFMSASVALYVMAGDLNLNAGSQISVPPLLSGVLAGVAALLVFGVWVAWRALWPLVLERDAAPPRSHG